MFSQWIEEMDAVAKQVSENVEKVKKKALKNNKPQYELISGGVKENRGTMQKSREALKKHEKSPTIDEQTLTSWKTTLADVQEQVFFLTMSLKELNDDLNGLNDE